MSADFDDCDVLSHVHFLIAKLIAGIPEFKLLTVNENMLKFWQNLTKIIQDFWKIWSKNYLRALQQTIKWYFKSDILKISTIAVLKENILPVYN